jgi:hypothetical protein
MTGSSSCVVHSVRDILLGHVLGITTLGRDADGCIRESPLRGGIDGAGQGEQRGDELETHDGLVSSKNGGYRRRSVAASFDAKRAESRCLLELGLLEMELGTRYAS